MVFRNLSAHISWSIQTLPELNRAGLWVVHDFCNRFNLAVGTVECCNVVTDDQADVNQGYPLTRFNVAGFQQWFGDFHSDEFNVRSWFRTSRQDNQRTNQE